jgi:hypothetical protein
MFLKSYHHLHPLPKAKSYFVYKNDEYNNLDILKMVAVNSELHHKLLISQNFNKICMKIIDISKISNAFWSGRKNMKLCSHGVLARQILGIISFQIEIERICSLVGILTNLRVCDLQS